MGVWIFLVTLDHRQLKAPNCSRGQSKAGQLLPIGLSDRRIRRWAKTGAVRVALRPDFAAHATAGGATLWPQAIGVL